MTEKEAEENLFHLIHINTYLDLNKEEFKIKNETLIKWSESTDTIIKALEQKYKEIDSWKKYSNEQEESIIEKSNKICDMEFKIQNQQKEISELKEEINYWIECAEGEAGLIKQIQEDYQQQMQELLESEE